MPEIDADGRYRTDPTATAPAGTETSPRTQRFMPAEGSATDEGHGRRTERDVLRDPVGALREPDNRHKLWLATAALTLLNTLLLLGLLFTVAGDSGPQPVLVDGQPCLVVEGEDAGTLYCSR